MDEKMAKMMQFSDELIRKEQSEKEAESKILREKRLRKTVFDTIVSLSSTVSEDFLLDKLPVLDCESWDEVVEERYLGKLCGFPCCDNEVTIKKIQKYHIDRLQKKIFEYNNDRTKFCKLHCFRKSVSVRSQLCPHPIWVTGYPKNKPYSLECEEEPLLNSKTEGPRSIEVVSCRRRLVANSELKVAERDVSDDDDDREEGLGNSEDEEFVNSIKSFIASTPSGFGGSKSSEVPNVEKKAPSPKENKQSAKQESDKLEALRQKYAKKTQKKAPIIIQPKPIDVSKELDECLQKMETVTISTPSTSVNNDQEREEENFVINLLRSWWTEDSKITVAMGGRKVKSDNSEMLSSFLANYHDVAELSKVKLPDIDCVNVSNRQLKILLTTLKKTWLQMEKDLNIAGSSFRLLTDLLASFSLSSDSVAGFDKRQLNLICVCLFRIVVRMTPEAEELYFPEGHPSESLLEHLSNKLIPLSLYANLCKQITTLVD